MSWYRDELSAALVRVHRLSEDVAALAVSNVDASTLALAVGDLRDAVSHLSGWARTARRESLLEVRS